MKYAAIDIGSNAIRLMIGEIVESNGFKKVIKSSLTRIPIRLGEDTFNKGKISKENTSKLVKALKSFKLIMELYDVIQYRIVATSALREAENKDEVITKVFEKTKERIELISGKEEARLLYSNIKTIYGDSNNYFVHIDVGGGSTEINLILKGEKLKSKSFKLGSVRNLNNKDKPEDWQLLDKYLQEINLIIKNNKTYGIGTGGNINKYLKLCSYDFGNRLLPFEELKEKVNTLKKLSYKERIETYRLKEDRADVIIPAGELYKYILKKLMVSSIYIPKVGLADGIILNFSEG